MDLMKNNTTGAGARGIDRSTSLPPELLGQIYEHLWSPDDNQFLPIANALLHFQRSNLYKVVHFQRRHLVLKFCDTIIQGRSNIREMVKDLAFRRGSGGNADNHFGVQPADPDIDQLLGSMLPQLICLDSLKIFSSFIAQSVFTSFATTPAPSSLTLLNLTIRLKTLDIHVDYRSPSIRNLIASTESVETTLRGYHTNLALASLRNSEVLNELDVDEDEDEEVDEEADSLDSLLLKFTSLKKLRLGGGAVCISDHFFTDYFKPELPLESLNIMAGVQLKSSDLIRAFKTKPSSLRFIELDTNGDHFFDVLPDDFDGEGIRKLVEIYESGGVEVKGRDVDTVRDIDEARLDLEEEAGSSPSDFEEYEDHDLESDDYRSE